MKIERRGILPSTMRPNSIRARMTVGFAVFTALLMLAFCGAFGFGTRHANAKNADALLRQAAQEIRQDIADSTRADELPSDFLGEVRASRRSNGLAILVVDPSGRVVAHSPAPIPAWPLRGDSWRVETLAARNYKVILALPWHETEETLRERVAFLLVLSAFVVVFASLGAWILVGRTLLPIDALARQAQIASTENLQVRLQTPSPDQEIVRLVETLNDFLARWSETARSRERFYAAAAHELRTPLQALSGHLEVALNRPRSALEYEIALRESHAQTERLTTLVQDLLLLNQLECETVRPNSVALDVADLCESELRTLRDLIGQRHLEVELVLPARCEIEAPWNHATMLLRNLLENAVKYAKNGGLIRVELSQKTLTICNDCARANFPADNRVLDIKTIWSSDEETEKLFEPFYRPDASRTSSTGGNGLGLAICRAICRSNNWEISLRQTNETVCATVVFATGSAGS